MSKLLSITLLSLLFFPVSSMAFFFSKNLDAKEFTELLNELPEGSISKRQIKRVALKNKELPSKPLENIYFKSCKWDSVDAIVGDGTGNKMTEITNYPGITHNISVGGKVETENCNVASIRSGISNRNTV